MKMLQAISWARAATYKLLVLANSKELAELPIVMERTWMGDCAWNSWCSLMINQLGSFL